MPKRPAANRGAGGSNAPPPGTARITAADVDALNEASVIWLQWAGPPPEPRTRYSPKPGEWVQCSVSARQGRPGRQTQQWTLVFSRFKTKDMQWDLAAEAAAGRVSRPCGGSDSEQAGDLKLAAKNQDSRDSSHDDDSDSDSDEQDNFSPKRLRSKVVHPPLGSRGPQAARKLMETAESSSTSKATTACKAANTKATAAVKLAAAVAATKAVATKPAASKPAASKPAANNPAAYKMPAATKAALVTKAPAAKTSGKAMPTKVAAASKESASETSQLFRKPAAAAAQSQLATISSPSLIVPAVVASPAAAVQNSTATAGRKRKQEETVAAAAKQYQAVQPQPKKKAPARRRTGPRSSTSRPLENVDRVCVSCAFAIRAFAFSFVS
eukprot:SAG31_NODE_742_length_12424_cov_16.082353_12_plen_384_part_00